jgi:hypothetical protein
VTASKYRQLEQARGANRDGDRLLGDRVSGAGQRGQEPFDVTSAAWVGDHVTNSPRPRDVLPRLSGLTANAAQDWAQIQWATCTE